MKYRVIYAVREYKEYEIEADSVDEVLKDVEETLETDWVQIEDENGEVSEYDLW